MAFIPSLGSVAAWIQSDNASVITVLQNSSIIALQSGSVVSINQGSIAAVIIGGSIATSSPANQSVSGTVGASIIGVVPIIVTGTLPAQSISGVVVQNAPTSSWISGTTSVFTGVIQPVIAAQGTSIFTYVTGVQVANNSANPVYVSFLNAVAGSIIGYTIAPGNGGSNITMPNALKTLANGAFSASISGVASVFVTAEGFTQNT